MNIRSELVFAVALWSLLSGPFSLAFGAQPQVLHGHVPKITKKLSPLGRLDANQQMQLAIGLPLRNRQQLTNLLEDIYNPSSPNFRHFLTADEFAASFGPTAEDLQSVIAFAKAHHLKVEHTHPNRTLVDVSGSVADIENAFNVRLQRFKPPKENREFFAPDVEPSLNLKTPVLAISGLDSYVKPTPRLHRSSSLSAIHPMGGGGGGTGTYTGPYQGYQFRDAYVPDLSQEGEGQSVGIFELYGYSIQDIEAYEDESLIYPYVPVQSVLIDGATDDDSNALDADGYLSYALETTGDIEMAIAMAPSLSKVLVYIGPTPMNEPPLGTSYIQDPTTTAQINDVLNRMATDNQAKQLSCSYGMDINLSTVQIFQQYAAQGQSFFLASGDSGAFTSAVDEPADNPYITLVGGTSLTTDTNGVYKSETVWLTPADPSQGSPEYASGGGVSMAYPIPSWQQGISMTANQGSTTMRNVPDVALVADNITVTWGYEFFDPTDFPLVGTSLAAPLWAGFMALVNQQAALNNQPPIGFVNATLYAIGKSTNYVSSFHDITTGRNTNAASPTKYSAVAGYDLCTGWGTISSNLFNALLAPPSERLRVTSPLGFTSFGKSGGPFSVTSQTYTLQNTGSAPLTWSVNNSASWLNVSATGGTLNPSASTTVTVSLNANANSFLITRASGNVAFNNITAGTTQNRQFDLYVGNGGFENGALDYWTQVGDPTLTFALAADDADIAGQQALPGQPDTLFVRSGLYGGYLGQWPDNGQLSQTVPTIVNQPLLVSYWLTSVPDDGGNTTPNGFAAKWNGSTLFTGTNLPASGWTNMQYIVSSAGTSGTLEFDFNNTPGAFGLDDVTVQALPAPVLYSAAVSGGNVSFNWDALLNTSYQVQSSTTLTSN
ncbi:MAG: protease pro-enzyme activation domain-containing protein, partial [Limisphaerales bacterium]